MRPSRSPPNKVLDKHNSINLLNMQLLTSNCADHDRTRSDADPDLETKSPVGGQLAVQGFVGSDQADRGRHGSIDMVGLVAIGTKSRHDSVADELLDHTAADRDRP